jgi:hypothetical protein
MKTQTRRREPDQKDPGFKARDESASRGVLGEYVGASGSSGTKEMSLFIRF